MSVDVRVIGIVRLKLLGSGIIMIQHGLRIKF